MASEWQVVSLADAPVQIIDGDRGQNYPKQSDFLDQGHCLFLNAGNVTTQGFNFSQCQYITSEKDQALRKGKLERHDVVLTTRGTVGNVAFYDNCVPFNHIRINSGMVIFRADTNRLFPLFLYQVLRSKIFTAQVATLQTGSAQPQLPIRDINRIRIPIPPLPEQRAIAAILGALDDKIELNRRTNATLEGIARALFKSWFVDFDPVRAKAEGRRMKDEIAALFPDALVDSELGEIPRGWRVTNLGKQVNAAKGLSYKGEHLCHEGEGLPLHNLNSVYEGGGYKFEGMKWYSGEYKERHLLEPGDVIVTNTEQGFEFLLIGYAAIVPKHFGPKGLFSHHIYRLRPRKDSYLPPWFFYLLLRTSHFHQIVAGYSNGTTVNMLPADGMQKPQFVLPPKALIEQFERLFTTVAARIETIYEESRTLAALRDALLPKLLSGELRVPDAERLCAEGGL